MVAPIDYTTQVADPFAQAAQGVKLGAGMAELQLLEQQRQQALQQQQRLAQAQAEFFSKTKPTMRDALQYASLLPKDQADAIRPYIENFSKEQQQGVLKTNTQILSALEFDPPTGIKMLRQYAAAQRGSGDVQEADLYDRLADAAEDPAKGPAMAFQALTRVTSNIPGAKDMFEAAEKALATRREEELRKPRLEKAEGEAQQAKAKGEFATRQEIADLEKKAADLGLTKAQTGSALAQTKKLNTEIARAALELEALKASGGVDPEKKFTQEEKIRKEWQGRSKVYGELQGTFSNIQASSSAGTGAGDIALITGFMKMLDPGSVVRETEFATARDTAGLFTQLENRLQKAKDGQLLKPDQRQQYVNLAKQYLEAAQKKADQEKKDLGIVVKNYKLNPENVFGAERAPADVPVQVTLPDGRVATFQNQKAADDFKAKAGL
jgi:hypothetical protein